MTTRLCPFCKKELDPQRGGTHLYGCNKKIKDRKEIRFLYIQYNFPEISKEEILYQKYVIELYSLPMLKKEFDINSGCVMFLLDWYAVPKRTASESMLNIGIPKIKETCLEKYGSTNCLGKESPLYEKRNKTVKEKYGVDNVFQIPKIIKWINSDALYLERYGKTKKQYKGDNRKEVISHMTLDEKMSWLNKSILSNHPSSPSSLEIRIAKILREELHIQYFIQFPLSLNKNQTKIYDFYLEQYNLLIEVQGDYWHANPKLYKAQQILNFHGKFIKAEEIWSNDKIKKELALKHNFNIIYIWENDIKKMYDNDLKLYILERINNATIKN